MWQIVYIAIWIVEKTLFRKLTFYHSRTLHFYTINYISYVIWQLSNTSSNLCLLQKESDSRLQFIKVIGLLNLFVSIYVHTKGDLISEDILTLVPLPTKGGKSLAWAENVNFPPITYSNFMFKGVIWHFLFAMEPKVKYLLKLSHL